jgi:hypothetical protein
MNSNTSDLLAGKITIDPNEISEATLAILQNIPLTHITPIDGQMHTSELIQGYKIWRESTSTSILAILCKVAWQPNQPSNAPSLEHRIFNSRTQLLNLALTNSIVYDRWTKVVTTMIEKDAGNPRIERFRVIHTTSFIPPAAH